MSITCDNFINGTWVAGSMGAHKISSAYSGENIGEFSIPSSAQIDQAIVAASVAQKAWAKAPLKERAQVLLNARNILLRDADKIAKLKGSECGKAFDRFPVVGGGAARLLRVAHVRRGP